MTESTLKLYAHPFSSYCQKALIALYENATPFDLMMLDGSEPVASVFADLWPLGRFPILTDGEGVVMEATSIIEHLAVHRPSDVALIPTDPAAAVDVRMIDRIFDNYVMTPMQKIVGDANLHRRDQDPAGVEAARALLDRAYDWLNRRMMSRDWACGDDFTLADCAAAPALFYADWAHGIGGQFPFLAAYRKRLLRRPSVVRAVDDARPYRHLFPLGAPNAD